MLRTSDIVLNFLTDSLWIVWLSIILSDRFAFQLFTETGDHLSSISILYTVDCSVSLVVSERRLLCHSLGMLSIY